MLLFAFYRLYTALAAGAAFYVFVRPSMGLAIAVAAGVRLLWLAADIALAHWRTESRCRRHLPHFRQEFGPYGIRIANKSQTDPRIRRSLAEAFDPNPARLRKTVEQLEALDALFSAGLRPEGDEYLLHDLKLKYARRRLGELEGGWQPGSRG